MNEYTSAAHSPAPGSPLKLGGLDRSGSTTTFRPHCRGHHLHVACGLWRLRSQQRHGPKMGRRGRDRGPGPIGSVVCGRREAGWKGRRDGAESLDDRTSLGRRGGRVYLGRTFDAIYGNFVFYYLQPYATAWDVAASADCLCIIALSRILAWTVLMA